MDENVDTEQTESRDFARVRTRAEEAEARAKALEAKLLARTIRDAGFDPAAPIVQMIADKFDGDIEDATAFAAHATALGFVTTTQPAAQTNEVEQQIDLLQSRSDQLRDLAQQKEPASVREQIAAAEAAGDFALARSLKNRAVLDAAA